MSDFWFPHHVRISPLTGSGGMGDQHGPPVPADAEVKDEARLIRDADGAQIVSSAQVTVPLGTVAPLGSLVTVWPDTHAERTSPVLRVRRDENDPDLDSFQILFLE